MKSEKCPKCHNVVSNSDKFCPNCGTPINRNTSSLLICDNCKHENQQGVSFCEKCGKPVNAESKVHQEVTTSGDTKKIVSKGSYSGTMVKGKSSRGWKIFRKIVLVLVLLAILALIIWFQVDPDAGKKLTDVLMGIGFMMVFFFVGWLFMRGKKGRKGDWDDDQYDDVADDDDDD